MHDQAELWSRIAHAWGERLPWLGLTFLVGVGLVVLERRACGRAARWCWWGSLALVVGAGLWRVWSRLWLADDAFISFRYARNFARGAGLVFNVGEWVEGYTNFLWTLALGLAAKLDLDLPLTALAGNALCYVLLVWITAVAVRRAAPTTPVIPFAAIAVALAPAVTTYGSSGLETVPAALLVIAGVAAASDRRRLVLSGALFVLAAMTRPDHLPFWGSMGLALALEDLILGGGPWLSRLRWVDYTRFTLPLGVLYVPYFLWRWHTYGDLFPNTYYAKNGSASYYAQGWIYLILFLGATGLPLLLMGWASTLAWLRGVAPVELRIRLCTAIAMLVYGHYVVRVGGDFMEYRFLLVLIPLLAVSYETSLRWWLATPSTGTRVPLRLAFGVAAFAILPLGIDLVKPLTIEWHVAAEHTYYSVKELRPLRIECPYFAIAKQLERVFSGDSSRPKLLIDCAGMVGYYSDLPIVDVYGLTNRRIAHKPIHGRRRPGHEKIAALDDLLAEQVTLTSDPKWVPGREAETGYQLPGFTLFTLRYDPALDAALRSRTDVKPPLSITSAIEKAARSPRRKRVLDDHQFYSTYLERAPELLGELAPLERRLAEIADFEKGWPADVGVTGSFGIRGATGGMLPIGRALLVAREGIGDVRLPLGPLAADEIRFHHGGVGEHVARLLVEQEVVREARPAADELLPVSWDVADYRGRTAELVLSDEDPAVNRIYAVDAIHYSAPQDISDQLSRYKPAQGAAELLDELLEALEEELPPEHPAVLRFERMTRHHWSLDGSRFPPQSQWTGTAFGSGPVPGALAGQTVVTGIVGDGYASSYHGANAAVGQLAMPNFVIPRGTIAFRVGGGSDCASTFVALEVDGRVAQKACGRQDEELRRQRFNLTPHQGKLGRLVAVDLNRGSWGHILLDDVRVFSSE